MKIYCKVTEYGIGTDAYKSTLSFGSGSGGGSKKFCVIAAYSKQTQNEVYIDRIEKKDICTLEKSLNSFEEGTVKLVRLALWTIKQLYPDISKFTLKDDSQILCDGEGSKDKMSMSFDYILKYNETWYQKKFNAELPGFISKTKQKNSNLSIIKSEENSVMEQVYNSFKILDENITPLSLVTDLLPILLDYKEEYDASSTPREFVNKLRRKFGERYCNIVGKWLNSYMKYLNIDFEMNKWYILDKYLIKPDNYSIKSITNSSLFIGGRNKNSEANSIIKRRRTYKKGTAVYELISDSYLTDSYVGRYDEI